MTFVSSSRKASSPSSAKIWGTGFPTACSISASVSKKQYLSASLSSRPTVDLPLQQGGGQQSGAGMVGQRSNTEAPGSTPLAAAQRRAATEW